MSLRLKIIFCCDLHRSKTRNLRKYVFFSFNLKLLKTPKYGIINDKTTTLHMTPV